MSASFPTSEWKQANSKTLLLVMDTSSTFRLSAAYLILSVRINILFYLAANSTIGLTEFLLCDPKLAFAMVKHLSSNVYQAKGEGFKDSLLQAAMAAASYG